MNTNPRRRVGVAAVLARAVAAGTIASSSGNASVAPMPRRNVRRGMNRLVRNAGARLELDAGFIGIGLTQIRRACIKENGRRTVTESPRNHRPFAVTTPPSATPAAFRIVNGALFTIPRMTDEKR